MFGDTTDVPNTCQYIDDVIKEIESDTPDFEYALRVLEQIRDFNKELRKLANSRQKEIDEKDEEIKDLNANIKELEDTIIDLENELECCHE